LLACTGSDVPDRKGSDAFLDPPFMFGFIPSQHFFLLCNSVCVLSRLQHLTKSKANMSTAWVMAQLAHSECGQACLITRAPLGLCFILSTSHMCFLRLASCFVLRMSLRQSPPIGHVPTQLCFFERQANFRMKEFHGVGAPASDDLFWARVFRAI
jgi:hypothetical protein